MEQSERELKLVADLISAQKESTERKLNNLHKIFEEALQKFMKYADFFNSFRLTYKQLASVKTDGKISEIFRNKGFIVCWCNDENKEIRKRRESGASVFVGLIKCADGDIALTINSLNLEIAHISDTHLFEYLYMTDTRNSTEEKYILGRINELNNFLSRAEDFKCNYENALLEVESYIISLKSNL